MKSQPNEALPVFGNPAVPQEETPSSFHYKEIPITITEHKVIVLHQPFACIADVRDFIDRNMYQ